MEPQRQPQINVNPETKKQADDFMTTMNAMFETIEMLAGADRPMNEGEWLVLAKHFQKLHQAKTQTETTYIYVEAHRTSTRGRVMERKTLTKAEKLADDKSMTCPSCKKVMTKRHYAEKHNKAGVCEHIQALSSVVSHNSGIKKSDVSRVKISDKELTFPEISLNYSKRKGEIVGLEFKEKEAKQYSIATRSMMLYEVFKPARCLAGVVSIQGQIWVSPVLAVMGHYEKKTISYTSFVPEEVAKRWKKVENGKWKRATIQIKRPVGKLKLKIVPKKTEAEEEHRQTTSC